MDSVPVHEKNRKTSDDWPDFWTGELPGEEVEPEEIGGNNS